MAAMVKDRDLHLGVPQRLSVSLRGTYRHDCVLPSPDDVGWKPRNSFQEVRQRWIVQNRLPCQPGVFSARILERLELLRCALTAIELWILRRGIVIVNAMRKCRAGGDGKDIHDLTLGGLDSHGRDQHHSPELSRIYGRPLRRNPPADGEADNIDWKPIFFAERPRIPQRQIVDVAQPVDLSGFA